MTHFPPKHGLYDPAFEKDSCGVGFVAHIKGERSNQIVLTPINATNSSAQPRGWRCVESGKPGKWEAFY